MKNESVTPDQEVISLLGIRYPVRSLKQPFLSQAVEDHFKFQIANFWRTFRKKMTQVASILVFTQELLSVHKPMA